MSKQVTQRLTVEVITDRALSPEELRKAAQNLEQSANRGAPIPGTGGFWRVPRAGGFERTESGGWVEKPYRRP